jgi:hypothetical protein
MNTTSLKITEMMLEAEIAAYAAAPLPRDIEVERNLCRRVVILLSINPGESLISS